MLDISKLSSDSYIPGVGETVYAIRRKKRRNSVGRWIQCPRNTDVEIVQVIVDEITFFRPIGATELAWKGAGYPPLSPDDTFYGQVRICKANVASTQEEAEALLAKFKKIGLSFNVGRSEEQRLNSSHTSKSRMPSSA